MATDHLQVPDIQASQNNKEVTANTAHNLLDRAMNQIIQKAITVDAPFTTTETRENIVIELTGTDGNPHFLDMPDTNERFMTVVNNTDDVMTIRNSVGGGTGQPVLAVGQATIFHYDGTDFIDYFAIATAAKGNVIAATTAALTLATDVEATDVLDGVTLVAGDRIFVKDQALGQENGIYIVRTAAAPVRALDFDSALDMEESPVLIPVLEGTANAGTLWMHTTTGTIVVDTTPLTFAQLGANQAFLALTDTPANYTDQSGKHVAVNAAENALEFVGASTKIPVRLATTASLTLASDLEGGTDNLDGVALVVGDRVLVKDQGSAENGLYIITSGVPDRADDYDDDTDPIFGGMVAVVEGTVNANTVWQLTTAGPYTIGGTTLVFVQIDFIELFTALTDVPSSFTNFGGQQVTVAAGEATLEFTAQHAKIPVRAASTVAATLASDFADTDTMDGISLSTGDRILIKDQSAGAENGIYVVTAGAPDRAIDMDDNADVILGETIPVLLGDTNARSVWMHTAGTDIGVDTLVFVRVGADQKDIYIHADQMIDDAGTPTLATVNLTAGQPLIRAWDFDQTTPESVQFAIPMPREWDLGTIDVELYWSHTGGAAFVVRWGIAAVSVANDGAIDVAFGTQITVDDTGGTTDDQYIAVAATITVGGTLAEGDMVYFEVERVAGSDTLDVDARLQGVRIIYNEA